MHGVILDGVLRDHFDTQTHTHTEQRACYAFGTYSATFTQVASSWFPWVLTIGLHASTMKEEAKMLVTARNFVNLSTKCSLYM